MKEKNRLIADFMENYRMVPLVYDISWNKLMPVVEKIEALLINKHKLRLLTVDIIGNSTSIHNTGACPYHSTTELYDRIKLQSIRTFGKTKIEGCHMAVVEFIELYNKYEYTRK